MSLHIIILAAGQGKRMYSSLPKVLHRIAGTPMLQRVVETATALAPEKIHVIYGHGGEQLQQALPDLPVHWVKQDEQLGTGHAVMQALPHIPPASQVLILSGDVPLIQVNTLRQLMLSTQKNPTESSPLGLLVTVLDNPFGLGRIVRNDAGQIIAVVEERDANEQERAIQEIYTGVCCASAADLNRWLPKLSLSNAQAEYYLTEIIGMCAQEGTAIASFCTPDNIEVLGVNNPCQLETLERIWQRRQAEQLMNDGVRLADANRIDIRGQLTCEKDVFIDVNGVFEGAVHIGEGSSIAPHCILKNVRLGKGCEILAYSILEDCVIGDGSHVGPFARLRPGTVLGKACKIGNFVETKKAVLGDHSKASHLSYLGDATIGQQVNIGAGTITCNYDGVNKHQTIIEDGVFVGSDTQFVAPVTIGKNATIGAGSTIRKDVPAEELTLTVSTQKTVVGWKRPVKKH